MEQFSEEYIKEVRDIIKNNDTEKAKELLKGLHPINVAELVRARIWINSIHLPFHFSIETLECIDQE